MKTVIGGYSALDIPRLDFTSLEEASQFMKSYGYDPEIPEEMEAAWEIYETSIDIMKKHILSEEDKIPKVLRSRESLKDIRHLMVYASTRDHADNTMQMWSCAILRVMHCVAHVENDLFFHHTHEIQEQILLPIQEHIFQSPEGEIILGSKENTDQVTLVKFESKAFKEKHSMVVKTLSKPETVAIDIFDKVGVRFITSSIIDSFRVVRYLRRENIVSFPNIVPHQSKNTLYPMNFFFEVLDEFEKKNVPVEAEAFEQRLKEFIESADQKAEFREKYNPFSGANYKMIKFVGRHLVKVRGPWGATKFFYPYELQVVDEETYLSNMSGTSAHEEYKRRQKRAAKERMLGEIFFVPVSGES